MGKHSHTHFITTPNLKITVIEVKMRQQIEYSTKCLVLTISKIATYYPIAELFCCTLLMLFCSQFMNYKNQEIEQHVALMEI